MVIVCSLSCAGEAGTVRPRLTLIVDTKDGVPVNAGLSKNTRQYLQTLALSQKTSQMSINSVNAESSSPQRKRSETPQTPENIENVSQQGIALPQTGFNPESEHLNDTDFTKSSSEKYPDTCQRVEISLTSDSEFFQLLQTEMTTLEDIQDREKEAMADQIKSIAHSVSKVATPSSKSDLYRWREIFDLYTQANIFFSTSEADRGGRKASSAAKQLQWFETQLEADSRRPKTKAGRMALEQFTWLNRVLLRNLQFQEINSIAMTKILKSTCDLNS